MVRTRIFLSHNNRSFSDSFTRIFQEHNSVTVENNSDRVPDIINTSAFDVILLDCGSPVQGGMDLVRKAKQRNPLAAVLAIISLEKEKEVEALRAGVDYIVQREDGAEEIVLFTHVALRRHYLHRVLPGFHGRFLYDIAKGGTLARRQGPFLTFALSTALSAVRGDGGSLMLLDDKARELRLAAAYGLDHEAKKSAHKMLGEKIAGWVAETKEGVILDGRLETDSRFSPFFKDQRSIVSAVSVPLIADGKGIGTLNINAYPPSQKFGEKDLEILTLIAHEIGDGLTRVRETEMLELDRVESLKNMALIISDKVKNPLAALFLNLNCLLEHPGAWGGEDIRKILKDCDGAGKKISAAVDSLKAFWKIT